MRQGNGTGAGRRAGARGTLDPSAGDPAGPDGTADGPVKDRVKMLLAAVVAAGTGFVLLLVFATVFNQYKGTRSNALIRSPGSIARLRACCAVHAPPGWAVTPRLCTRRFATSNDE